MDVKTTHTTGEKKRMKLNDKLIQYLNEVLLGEECWWLDDTDNPPETVQDGRRAKEDKENS